MGWRKVAKSMEETLPVGYDTVRSLAVSWGLHLLLWCLGNIWVLLPVLLAEAVLRLDHITAVLSLTRDPRSVVNVWQTCRMFSPAHSKPEAAPGVKPRWFLLQPLVQSPSLHLAFIVTYKIKITHVAWRNLQLVSAGMQKFKKPTGMVSAKQQQSLSCVNILEELERFFLKKKTKPPVQNKVLWEV